MKKRRDPFQAIADPTRRAILVLLASQTLTAGSIAEKFDSARPTISKHLQILSECDLVRSQKVNREIYYDIQADKMKEIDIWLEQFRKIWEDRFDQLEDLLIKIQKGEKK